jgi:hypothetical protein
LFDYVLIVNERNANKRYRRHNQVWQSDEWATLVRVLAEKTSLVPSEPAAVASETSQEKEARQRTL